MSGGAEDISERFGFAHLGIKPNESLSSLETVELHALLNEICRLTGTRAAYNCGSCYALKRGHKCPYEKKKKVVVSATIRDIISL